MSHLALNRRQFLELEKLAVGAFAPLSGFMTEDELRGVVGSMRLPSGNPFPMPIVLDVTPDVAAAARPGTRVSLTLDGLEVGDVLVESVYACDKAAVAVEVFGTADEAHPGVAHFFRMGSHFIGGPVHLHRRVRFEFSDYELTPDEARARFAERGWRTIVGFQTRNVPHRAHGPAAGCARTGGRAVHPAAGRTQETRRLQPIGHPHRLPHAD